MLQRMKQCNIFIRSLISHETLHSNKLLLDFGYKKSIEHATNIKSYIIIQYIITTVTFVESVPPKQ